MRFRFSLRTFFLLLAVFAVTCYVCLARPAQLAEQFAGAINAQDFHAADKLFRHVDDQFLANWADKRWAFKARCDVHPLTLGQLLSARRQVIVDISYFEHDASANRQAVLTVTPFGIAAPAMSSVTYGGMLIDEGRQSTRQIPRR